MIGGDKEFIKLVHRHEKKEKLKYESTSKNNSGSKHETQSSLKNSSNNKSSTSKTKSRRSPEKHAKPQLKTITEETP